MLGGTDYIEKLAVSNEDTGLTSPDKNIAILTLIYIDTGCSVKKEDVAFLAIRYLKLLHLKFTWLTELALEPPVLEDEILTL